MVPSGLIISPASDITEVADSPFHYQRFPPHCSTSTFPKWSPQATFWSQSVLKHQRSLAASKGVSLHFMTGVEVGVEVGVEAGVTKVLVKRAKHWLHAHASCQPLYAHAPPRRRSQSCNKLPPFFAGSQCSASCNDLPCPDLPCPVLPHHALPCHSCYALP
ncbi:hypothetical protein TcWFU_008903 [Taenia crassiceps]|uniref:Uncharacterized protein n=1 Tax=Taenia crassiceps TaxID=6207 RepID=A0ABR4QC01_9CEST